MFKVHGSRFDSWIVTLDSLCVSKAKNEVSTIKKLKFRNIIIR